MQLFDDGEDDDVDDSGNDNHGGHDDDSENLSFLLQFCAPALELCFG